MLYPDRRVFRLLLLLLDLCALIAAFLLGLETRIGLNVLYDFQMTPVEAETLVPPLGLILLLWLPMSAWLGLYRPRRGIVAGSALQVIESVAAVAILTIVVTFFIRHFGEGFSRSFVLFFSTYSLLTLMAARVALWIVVKICHQRGIATERVAIAGTGAQAKQLALQIEQSPGITLCGVIAPLKAMAGGTLGNPVAVIGSIDEAGALVNRHRLDRIIAVDTAIDPLELQTLAATCTRMGVALHRLPANLESDLASTLQIHQIGYLSLLEVRGLQLTPMQQVAKRIFDIVVCSLTLVALSPLLAALAVLIKTTSRGPIFYVAPRAGKGGRYFPFYKFRSMVAGADARREALRGANETDGHLFKIKDDPRLTPVGRFMRRYSLDELPQLLNVLKGDMSLVGPRPLPASDLDLDGLSREHAFWARERTRVLPGITGLWQVRGRSDLGFEGMIEQDLEYARSWSTGLDIRILLETIPVVLKGRGAY